jgi:hypothetical protein
MELHTSQIPMQHVISPFKEGIMMTFIELNQLYLSSLRGRSC